jgi:hypothetical protein
MYVLLEQYQIASSFNREVIIVERPVQVCPDNRMFNQ